MNKVNLIHIIFFKLKIKNNTLKNINSLSKEFDFKISIDKNFYLFYALIL